MTLLKLSLSGGIFILAIAAFRALTLRRLPKGTFVALWWLAALRLLLPVELSSRFSVYTLLEALRPKAAVPSAPVVPVTPAAPPVLIVPTQPAAAPVQPAPAPFPVWTALWLAVGLLLAAWFLIRYVRWRRRFRESLPADCPGLETWFQLRRKVQVRVTDQIAAPLTYGLLRPVVLLPGTMDFADEEALTCVLAHERAHIRRLDGLLKLALTAALCLHWFNPAVWLLYVLGNRDMELRCDEAAVLALGEDSRERYALALIRMAEKQCVPLCGFAHRNGMEERIKAIMTVKKKSLLACAVALAMVLGITTAFATSAKLPEADEPNHEDIIDGGLLAASSAESAALWDVTLAPYAPFGLTWTFDDPDLDGNGLTMTWEGHEVRGVYDEELHTWITEHAGDSTFGPDAVELYTVYEGRKLTGLRLATEEEQKAFDRDRQMSSDSLKVETLMESVHYDSGHIYFTIPESEKPWSIFIRGRILMEDGSGTSVHYLEEESEKGEWIPRMTYSFEVADAAYDELTLDVDYGNAMYCYELTLLLPEGKRLAAEPLPEGKADIPEGAEMIWPVDSTQITNSFGNRTKPGGEGVVTHTGVDIGGMEKGTPVYAAGKGTVKEAGCNATEGNFVRIDHGNGQETLYAHCEKLLVKTGDAVELGQTIATVGSTGQSTGPHLHFEVLVNGVAQDPEAMLKSGQDTAKPEPEKKPEPGNEPESEVKHAVPMDSVKSTLGGTLTVADEGDVRERMEAKFLVNGQYPVNSKGETYGSNYFARELGSPDLISAYNDDDQEGYIAREEDNYLKFATSEEGWAYTNWCEENNIGGWLIPLYDKEHNEIGTFLVGGGGGRIISFEELKEAKAQGWPNSKGSTPKEAKKYESEEAAMAAMRAAAEAGVPSASAAW